ncbi:aspartate kinase [Macrococcus equipercicus]|uniref:Aspartokinase n=1 Tax=Macrococcus equipercicus TaxID=69967 RepID=A0ABQ6RAD8_9STAP|nr:aspartate kinase [Macrococcus equipercicus]KAA1040256.1 aspartate kinase [Macrococcus equipercicus]
MVTKRSVLKFGGTSVADFEKIKNIGNYLKDRVNNDEQLVVVVSAMGKTTDVLLENVGMLSAKPNEENLALLLTTGEQQTISYLAIVLHELGVSVKALTGFQAGIKTMGHHMKSKIQDIEAEVLNRNFESHDVLVVAGFQGINERGEITTLGRGGSDTTAVAIASALAAPCEIYTDVAGVYSTDPRLYPAAKRLDVVSFEEMMEMSALGAGVLETRSVEIAKNYNIPIYLGKTLSDEKGTWIMPKENILEKKAVTGVALDKDMNYVTLSYPMYDRNLLEELFIRLEQGEINVDMISQIVNSDGLQLSFTMKDTDVNQINEIFSGLIGRFPSLVYNVEENYVKVSVIGSGMRDMSGVASKVFMTLLNHNINFYQVTTSEISISYVVNHENGQLAVEQLCQAFEL